jgi:hypothetical protein
VLGETYWSRVWSRIEQEGICLLTHSGRISTGTQGSVWGGTITSSAGASATSNAAAVTTEWRCELGGCLGCSSGLTGVCSTTVFQGSSTMTEATTQVDVYYLYQHSVPLILTAGTEKLLPTNTATTAKTTRSTSTKSTPSGDEAVASFLSYDSSTLSANSCSPRSTLQVTAAATTTTGTTTDTDTSVNTQGSPTAWTTTAAAGSWVAPLRNGCEWTSFGMGIVAASLGFFLFT